MLVDVEPKILHKYWHKEIMTRGDHRPLLLLFTFIAKSWMVRIKVLKDDDFLRLDTDAD